jgi:hypothetical protein
VAYSQVWFFPSGESCTDPINPCLFGNEKESENVAIVGVKRDSHGKAFFFLLG